MTSFGQTRRAKRRGDSKGVLKLGRRPRRGLRKGNVTTGRGRGEQICKQVGAVNSPFQPKGRQ